jgi:hypothetical protein
MGEAARARYQKLFSPKAVLPVILETYRRVADGEKPHSPSAGNGNGHSHPWAYSID